MELGSGDQIFQRDGLEKLDRDLVQLMPDPVHRVLSALRMVGVTLGDLRTIENLERVIKRDF